MPGRRNVTATYRYDPYGNSITATGTNAANNVYRFSSKEFHVRSGMYYYGYRFYDPNLQRWLNRDPLGEEGGINLYQFVFNEPTSLFDTDGREPTTVPNSGGHGNCLSYVLREGDNKDGGIQPSAEDRKKYPSIDPWLEAKLKAAGCKEKGDAPCAQGESDVGSLTGNEPKGPGNPFFHVMVLRCGSKHWIERNGDNGPIVLDPNPIENRRPDLKNRKVKHWCCPCKKS